MRHTLTAVYADRNTAQRALDELLASGYPDAELALATAPVTGDAASPVWQDPPGTSTARFLSRLFDHARSDPVADVPGPLPHESYILTLATHSEAEAERAASLVPDFVRVDREDNSWQPRRQLRNAPGALQYYGRGPEHYYGTREADDTSTIGTTFREPMLPAGQWPDTAPDVPLGAAALAAYRFGRDLHDSDRYRNRSWDEAGTELRQAWETRDPAGPDWDASAAAIRTGWDSTSPEIDGDEHYRSHWKTHYASGNGSGPAAHRPGPVDSGSLAASWKRRHPGELPPWEGFMDALRHGWDRISFGMDTDEASYRSHHADNYPGTPYEDLAPAYRYGKHTHRRAAFQGRDWDEVEDGLRTEWEGAHPDARPLPWDGIRAAVHRGWDG